MDGNFQATFLHKASRCFALLFFAFIVTSHWSTAANAQALPQFNSPVKGKVFSHRTPAYLAGAWPFDLNNDNRAEIVLPFNRYPPSENVAEEIKILIADPRKFSFSVASPGLIGGVIPSFVHSRVFAEGDFNGDSRNDLFIGGHGYDAEPFSGETDKILLSAPGNVVSAMVAPPELPSFTHAATSGDINRDGVQDVFVGTLCCGSEDGSHFLMGRLGQLPVHDTTRLPTAVKDRYSHLRYTAALLVDVDERNGVDLVLGNWGNDDNVVYLNDGLGGFVKDTPDFILPAGLFGSKSTITLDVRPVDLNTDGLIDLVLSQTANEPFYQGFGLQILINTGAGFTDQTSERLLSGSGRNIRASWAERIFIVDFFGDGIKDIMVAGKWGSQRTALFWVNDGKGVFRSLDRTFVDRRDTSDDQNSIYPVDVNQDRRTDLVRILVTAQTNSARSYQAWTYINKPIMVKATRAPVIVRQPQPVSVDLNAPLRLSVAAEGQRPLSFQWYRNGIAIPGATGPVLRISSVSVSDSGVYSVHVGGGALSTISSSVSVSVNN